MGNVFVKVFWNISRYFINGREIGMDKPTSGVIPKQKHGLVLQSYMITMNCLCKSFKLLNNPFEPMIGSRLTEINTYIFSLWIEIRIDFCLLCMQTFQNSWVRIKRQRKGGCNHTGWHQIQISREVETTIDNLTAQIPHTIWNDEVMRSTANLYAASLSVFLNRHNSLYLGSDVKPQQ